MNFGKGLYKSVENDDSKEFFTLINVGFSRNFNAMADLSEIQDDFFKHIKENLDANLSLVHEISEVLNVSYDSVYRRLRGEKKITLEEAVLLCRHFNLSLDEIAHYDEASMSFKRFHVEPGCFCVSSWLDFIIGNLKMISDASEKKIIYAAKDPPIFNYFCFPEIAAFKFFFWEKTLFKGKGLTDVKFDVSNLNSDTVHKCQLISSLSLKVPTTEIWNEDTFRILMRQVEYYWVSDYFKSKDDILVLLDQIEEWLNHNQVEAAYGMRFGYGQTPRGVEGSYVLYENEIIINDNSLCITANDKQMTFITYNVLGLLASTNPVFFAGIHEFHKSLISASNLISMVGEKERNRFFKKLHQSIEQFRHKYDLS
ncbi:helix-turn-helix transcriptional regulator [Labilibacter sediminis]|nr:helix-turn-helix transcriptional regulator [Labilibacter sediminis]